MSKEKKKILAIELKKEIQEVLKDYLKDAGIESEDLGFAMGYLNGRLGKDKEGLGQLMFMFQLYFFAGVRYAKETKEFGYELLTPEERDAKNKKILEGMEGMLKHSGDKPNYLG